MIEIKTVPPSDEDAVIRTIVLAFSADPVARWFYPEPDRLMESLPGIVKSFAEPAFAHGTADCAQDCAGAALWIPPGAHPDEEKLGALVRETIPEQRRADVLELLDRMQGFIRASPIGIYP